MSMTYGGPIMATQKVVKRWKTLTMADGTKIKNPMPPETQRRGYCKIHGCYSTSFIGPNEAGWVFHCNAKKHTTDEEQFDHYFVNAAP